MVELQSLPVESPTGISTKLNLGDVPIEVSVNQNLVESAT